MDSSVHFDFVTSMFSNNAEREDEIDFVVPGDWFYNYFNEHRADFADYKDVADFVSRFEDDDTEQLAFNIFNAAMADGVAVSSVEPGLLGM